MIQVVEAYEGTALREVHTLFIEYASTLGVSLDFQDFAAEVSTLPGDYRPPSGRLLLAYRGNQPAGCIGLRRFSDRICEMKRLYVRPNYQGLKIGRILAETMISEARLAGYTRIRLDTLPSMNRARGLYASLGFREIAPYRYNPIKNTTFLELTLA